MEGERAAGRERQRDTERLCACKRLILHLSVAIHVRAHMLMYFCLCSRVERMPAGCRVSVCSGCVSVCKIAGVRISRGSVFSRRQAYTKCLPI